MSDWGFWDWLAYGTTWVAAMVIAASAAVKIEPQLRERTPLFLKATRWGYVPLMLLMPSDHNWWRNYILSWWTTTFIQYTPTKSQCLAQCVKLLWYHTNWNS